LRHKKMEGCNEAARRKKRKKNRKKYAICTFLFF